MVDSWVNKTQAKNNTHFMIVTILYTVECKEFISIKIKSSKIYLYFLDHNGLIITIGVTKTKPKGKGFWNFNTSIIKHESLKAGFAKFLKNCQQEQYRYKSVTLWWEAGKTCTILNEKMKQNPDQNKIH